jgi:hydrogenase maturation protease
VAQSLILGIGNLLLADDGAGVHAARRLAGLSSARPDINVIDAGTLSLTLAPMVESADRLIVLDAAQIGAAAGSVHCFLDHEFDRFLGRTRLRVNEIGLRDVMDVTRLAGVMPQERALVAIQPASITWGTELTPAVAAGLEVMLARTLELLNGWAAGPALQTAPPPDVRGEEVQRCAS